MIGGAVFVGGREASIGSGGGARGGYFSCFSMSNTVDITSRVFYIFSNRRVEGSRIVQIVRYVEAADFLLQFFRDGFVVNIPSLVSISVTSEHYYGQEIVNL